MFPNLVLLVLLFEDHLHYQVGLLASLWLKKHKGKTIRTSCCSDLTVSISRWNLFWWKSRHFFFEVTRLSTYGWKSSTTERVNILSSVSCRANYRHFWIQLVCWTCISLLTRMLSNQCLSTSHAPIHMHLSIKINDALWSKDEEMLIEQELQIYHEKRRILSLEERESATKKARTVVAVEEEVNRQWVRSRWNWMPRTWRKTFLHKPKFF